MKPPKRSTSNMVDQKRTKRTKPNPTLAHESKRRFLSASNERAKVGKRVKPIPAVPSSVSPPSSSQRKVFMGQQPNLVHYPPPDKRGHRGTGYSSSDSSSHGSISSETAPELDRPECELEVRKEVFGLLSIGEKFAILSRPPTKESTKILQTKRCFSIHVVRGEIARSMKKKAKQKRDPSHRPPLNRESPFSSPSSSPEFTLVPRPQWIKDAQPDMSDDEADEIWNQSNKRMFGEGKHLSTAMPAVSSFTGGNTLKVIAEIQHTGGMQHVNLALDTQSDVTTSTSLRAYLTDIKPIVPDEVSGIEGSSIFAEEGILQVYSELKGYNVAVPALVAQQQQLPSGCVALLGVTAMQELEIAIDKHLRLPQFSPLICHLGEKKLREWLLHHPDSSIDTKPFDLEAIQSCPDLTPEQIKRVKAVIKQYEKVFEGHENTLPKPFATEPITLKFKENAQPQSIPQPRWTVAQKEIVTRWAEDGLRNGSLEPSTSAWSSRVHLVLKPPSNTTAELADMKV